MCTCKTKLENSIIGDRYQNRIIRKAHIIEPTIRLSYQNSTKREAITIEAPFCPFCGKPLNKQPNSLLRKLKKLMLNLNVF